MHYLIFWAAADAATQDFSVFHHIRFAFEVSPELILYLMPFGRDFKTKVKQVPRRHAFCQMKMSSRNLL
jgi:hypothetical protein